MSKLTLLETAKDGLVVDGGPFSVWQTIMDGRNQGQETVSLFRGKERFEVSTAVDWRIRPFEGRS